MSFNKLIVVPTDFSKNSEDTYKYACEIASITGAKILFVHIIEEPYDFAVRVDEYVRVKKKQTRDHLEELIHDLKQTDAFPDIPMQSKVLVGKVRITLLEFLKKKKPDLVIVGAKGSTSGIKSILYGTVTSRIMMDSPVPVLSVPKHVGFRKFDQVAFASDLRESDPKLIKKMAKFSKKFNVPLDVIHVTTDPDFDMDLRFNGFKKLVKSKNKKADIKVRLIKSSSFLDGISSYIRDNKSCILVMSRYKKKFLKWLSVNNSSTEFVQYSSVPVLILPGDV